MGAFRLTLTDETHQALRRMALDEQELTGVKVAYSEIVERAIRVAAGLPLQDQGGDAA